MLTVARPDIDWRQGDAAALPLPSGSFDAVLCQMALMFFSEPTTALREMARVADPAGTVPVLVPSGLDAQPAYGPFVDMASTRVGADARALSSTCFAQVDLNDLGDLFERAGL